MKRIGYLRFASADKSDAAAAFNTLANACFLYARASTTSLNDKMAKIAEFTRFIVDVWPTANIAAIGMLDSLVRLVDVLTAVKRCGPR